MKQERSRRTYERVLDAAAAEFAAHGYLGASLQHVADRTGLTKGAVYGHFASKNELAQALAQHLDQMVKGLIDQSSAADTTGAGALARTRALAIAIAEQLGSDVRSSAALHLATEEALARTEAPQALATLHAFLSGVLEAADAEGPPQARPPAPLLAELVIVLLVGAYYTAPAAARGDLAASVRTLWDALLPSPAGSGPRGDAKS